MSGVEGFQSHVRKEAFNYWEAVAIYITNESKPRTSSNENARRRRRQALRAFKALDKHRRTLPHALPRIVRERTNFRDSVIERIKRNTEFSVWLAVFKGMEVSKKERPYCGVLLCLSDKIWRRVGKRDEYWLVGFQDL